MNICVFHFANSWQDGAPWVELFRFKCQLGFFHKETENPFSCNGFFPVRTFWFWKQWLSSAVHGKSYL